MSKSTDSILLTVKKMLGIAEEYTAFDIDLIVNINSVFLTLNQLGVGPDRPYQIEGNEDTWSDFLGDQRKKMVGVETYVYLKTRLLFDPPTNSFLVTAMENQCSEFEWRLNIQAEGGRQNGNVSSKCFVPKHECNEFELSDERLRDAELLRASWNKGSKVGD